MNQIGKIFLSDDTIKQIHDLYNQGASTEIIAEKLMVPEWMVCKIIYHR